MSPADIVIIVALLLSVLIGVMRGFVREVFSLITWIASFWLAYQFSGQFAHLFEPYVKDDMLRVWAAFLGVFIVSLLALSLVSLIIRSLLSVVGVGGIDRSLGAVFGAVRGGVIIAVLLTMVRVAGADEARLVGNSQLAPYFEPLVRVMVDLVPSNLRTPPQAAAQSQADNASQGDAAEGEQTHHTIINITPNSSAASSSTAN